MRRKNINNVILSLSVFFLVIFLHFVLCFTVPRKLYSRPCWVSCCSVLGRLTYHVLCFCVLEAPCFHVLIDKVVVMECLAVNIY